MDKKQKFVLLSSKITDSYQKSIRFGDFTQKNGTRQQPGCLEIIEIHQIKETLQTINPIDIRIFFNEIEVMNEDRKLELIRDLIIIEQTHKSSTVLASVNESKLKILMAEQVIQDNTKALWNFHIGNNLSIDKYKKIKELLAK